MNTDSTMPPKSKGRKFIRKLLGAVFLLLGIALVFAKALFKFPIGLFTTLKLITASEGAGNIGGVLGMLTGDLIAFALCVLSLYFGIKLLRNPKAA